MGFPLGYSELLLPKLLLQLVFFLGFIRRLISWAFNFMGLGDLLLDSTDTPWPEPVSSSSRTCPHFKPVSAVLIQEILPVVEFRDLVGPIADSCAVCLYEFDGGDEVRRLGNCRHVFHRECLDRWIEHDQRTCPMCRTPLVPEEMLGDFNDRVWAAAGLPDSLYSEEIENFSSNSSNLYYSPALSFVGDQLISAY